jgi:hypothetical protein
VGAARGLDEVRLDYLFLDASFFPDASRLADRVGGTGPGAAEVLARLGGSQSGDLFGVATDDPDDGQSNGRTFDMGGTIRLSTGSLLYSRRSRPLLRIVDTALGELGRARVTG